MNPKPAKLCPVCRGLEPTNLNRMLLLGWSPRFIASRWGYSRAAIRRHIKECLTESERENVKRDLYAMVDRGERGEGPS